MAGNSIEIIIKSGVILAEAAKLERIAQSIAQERIPYQVNRSKGKTAEAVNSLINELHLAGDALSQLMMENAKNVRAIADQFTEMDSGVSSSMKG